MESGKNYIMQISLIFFVLLCETEYNQALIARQLVENNGKGEWVYVQLMVAGNLFIH